MVDPPKLLTLGRIALELGVTRAAVRRVLDAHPEIRPVAIAGTLRVFSRDDLPAIRVAVAQLPRPRRHQIGPDGQQEVVS